LIGIAIRESLQSSNSFLCEPIAKPKENILETVENGKYISVEYTGTLGNGEVFDSSVGRQPLEVLMGDGQLIQGFESQLMGMALNEKKTFTLTPEDAYGQKNDALMQFIPRSEVPEDMDVQIGMVVGFITPEGDRVPARVVKIDEAQLTMDLNHPLAGESLTFEIEVVGISNEPTQESHGCSSGCDCSGDCCE
jgi:peptidylprolyl isomerase